MTTVPAKVDSNIASIQIVTVHIANGTQRGLWIFKLDKSEAFQLVRFTVPDDADSNDPTNFGKDLLQLIFGSVEGEVPNEDVMLLP